MNIMKIQKIKIILSVAFVFLLMTACENQPITFDDYGKTACYFPYQTPARTIILGKYDEGFNDNDNLRQFEIGVVMTGVYENKENRKVYFEVDTALMSNILDVKKMPASYYNIETASPVIIPKGDTKGRILVKLTDAFFNDPKTVSSFFVSGTAPICSYAIPLKITKIEGLDSILAGKPLVVNPIRNKAADWSILPKDYTFFAVKYINKFHGNYLRRGADKVINNLTSVELGTTVYRTQYVEKNDVIKAITSDLNSVNIPGLIRRYNAPNGAALALKLQFANDGTCTVNNLTVKTTRTTAAVIGSGTLKEDSEMWGGKMHDAIYINYTYTDSIRNEKHIVNDTMVIRDRGVGFETFNFTLKP